MSDDEQIGPRRAVFDRVGGEEAFHRLVDDFYDKVEGDELLRPIYPEDLEPGKTHLAMFLAQYWGGGPIYSSERGHPRLRQRHADFEITPEAASRWQELMSEAITEQGWPDDVEESVLEYIAWATPTLVNSMPPIHERG